MHFFILTAFPQIFDSPLNETILRRAQEKGSIHVDVIGLRDFAVDKHLQLDDYPYGGGPGMVLKPEPIFRAFESLTINRGDNDTTVIFMSPQGTPLTQKKIEELSQFKKLVILCGRYKGVDQRVIDAWIDEEISIGDYILSGGEIPALVVIDSVSRLLPSVLGNSESAKTDSFHNNLLDYPQYTRPAECEGMVVPEVLLGGNHQKIAEWRLEQSIKKTAQFRKDLYEKYRAQLEEKNDE